MGHALVLDGRYEVRDRLGSDELADVYVGWDRRLERLVAIRWLRGDAAAAPGAPERFRREVIALAGVDSPHVVEVHDVGPAGEYVVTRHLAGPTLAAVVATSGPLPARRAIGIAVQVVDGLCDLRAHGLPARGVDPTLVVLERRDRVVMRGPGEARAGAPEGEVAQVGWLLHHLLTADRPADLTPALARLLCRAMAGAGSLPQLRGALRATAAEIGSDADDDHG